MSEFNAPRRGALSFYPRVRAKKETPSIKGYGTENKPLNFLAYKVGMVQALGKNVHKASPSFNHEVVVPATVIECAPLKVFGVRAYEKAEIGFIALSDVIAQNIDKDLKRKILNFGEKSQKNSSTEKKASSEKSGADKKHGKSIEEETYTISDFEKELKDIEYFTLLVHTQPEFKKTPEITEIFLGGTKEQQLAIAKEKLGKELTIEDVFKEGDLLDVKAVTKGKGFQGPVKRFGVRTFRPKHKKQRVVGSIGPWHPATVMFTVARAGQMGYQNRTEVNKKIIKISKNTSEVNPKAGFKNYGLVKGNYALIFGSLPGPAKRCIALRKSLRPVQKVGVQLATVERIIINQ
ncbi:MAG: 50S ribosomal protein L3 [Candidatus Diapherotrites archaeon]|nr:50S ribosomal protein L3 [Candidatus Diapherotrites archaeon]